MIVEHLFISEHIFSHAFQLDCHQHQQHRHPWTFDAAAPAVRRPHLNGLECPLVLWLGLGAEEGHHQVEVVGRGGRLGGGGGAGPGFALEQDFGLESLVFICEHNKTI